MGALLVIANPSASSFSHAMAEAARAALAGHEVVTHDLYAEGFEPLHKDHDPLVDAHCRDLVQADLIAVFHPNWWGQAPAILKGWLERVVRPGVAYEYPPGVGLDGIPIGLLRARAALVFNTSETPWQRELEVFGNPLERIWRDCVFGFCGIRAFERQVYGPMSTSSAQMRAGWLAEVRALVAKYA